MSVDPKLRVKQLIIGVQQDCGRYAELQQQLLRQHSLLAAHDVNGLAEHNQRQTQLMAAVQQQAQQRCQHLLALGLKPDEKGMATLIAKLPASLQKTLPANGNSLSSCFSNACARMNSMVACWPGRSRQSIRYWDKNNPMANWKASQTNSYPSLSTR